MNEKTKSLESLKDVTEANEALNEIIHILREEYQSTGKPLPKKDIYHLMSADVKPHFNAGRKLGVASGKLYVTQKGLYCADLKQHLTDKDRLYHLNWSLGLSEAATGQYLEDEDLLLKSVEIIEELVEAGTMEAESLAEYVASCAERAMMVKADYARISSLYDRVESRLRMISGGIIPTKTEFTKSVKELSEIKNIVEEDSTPRCKYCNSTSVSIIGKHKDTIKCHDCKRIT